MISSRAACSPGHVHGELVLLAGGVAAERGDASLLAILALAAAAAVAGDAVSFLLGRGLGRPSSSATAPASASAPPSSPASSASHPPRR